ncbi:MAG: hypothetical protein ACLRMZ_13425 [Blautia marasmi]
MEKDAHPQLFVLVKWEGSISIKRTWMWIQISGSQSRSRPCTGQVISEKMIASYVTGELDEVYIIYTRMANAANMVAEMQQLLPLKRQVSIHRHR